MVAALSLINERQQEYLLRTKSLKKIGEDHSKVGYNILSELWFLYSKGLVTTEGMFETFAEYCEFEIEPSFESVDYLRDFEQIVDRVFKYVHECWFDKKPITDRVGMKYQVDWFLKERKGWISKLILLSQKLPYCKTDDQKRELFNVAFSGTREELKQAAESVQSGNIPVQIPSWKIIYHDNGTRDVLMEGLNDEQYNVVRAKIGKLLDESNIHID